MLTTVPTGRAGIDGYGLGIFETKLPNGVSIWGHTGGILGFSTIAGGTLGGNHTLVVSLNSLGRDNSPNPFKVFYLLNLASRKKWKIRINSTQYKGLGPLFEDYDNLLTAISVIKGELNYG